MATKAKDPNCGVCKELGAMQGKLELLGVELSTPALTQSKKAADPPTNPKSALEAPPDITQIGQAGWTILHTTAAYYPKVATALDKSRAVQFLVTFAQLFPCRWCGDDFIEHINSNPPALEGREEFSLWMCEAHNNVNKKLGKDLFDCSRTLERWRRFIPDED